MKHVLQTWHYICTFYVMETCWNTGRTSSYPEISRTYSGNKMLVPGNSYQNAENSSCSRKLISKYWKYLHYFSSNRIHVPEVWQHVFFLFSCLFFSLKVIDCLLITEAPFTNIEIWAWVSNYIHSFIWDVISDPWHNFSCNLTKPPLKLGHR